MKIYNIMRYKDGGFAIIGTFFHKENAEKKLLKIVESAKKEIEFLESFNKTNVIGTTTEQIAKATLFKFSEEKQAYVNNNGVSYKITELEIKDEL